MSKLHIYYAIELKWRLMVSSTLSSFPRLENATATLHDNFASFAMFVANYLNGRHKHLSAHLRSEIKSFLKPFFTDASDIRQLTSRIINAAESSLKLEAQEIHALSSDLRKPLVEVFDALIEILTKLMEDKAPGENSVQALGDEGLNDAIICLN